MALVTFETVAQAASDLVASGKRASVRQVIAQLGGGSPNSVLGFLSQYKAGRPAVTVADTELDPSIAAAIRLQMQKVAEHAYQVAVANADDCADTMLLMSETVATQDRTISTQSDDLNRANQQISDLADQLETAKDQLDVLPKLQAQIDKLTADLDKQTSDKTMADQKVAVLASKLESETKLQEKFCEDINQLNNKLNDANQKIVDLNRYVAVLEERLLVATGEKTAQAKPIAITEMDATSETDVTKKKRGRPKKVAPSSLVNTDIDQS